MASTVCTPMYSWRCNSGYSKCSQAFAEAEDPQTTCEGKKDKKGKWRTKKCLKKVTKKPSKCGKKKIGKKCKLSCCEAGYTDY